MPETELPAAAAISPTAISFILLGFVLFFLVISAIIGFRRGFKKSLFRFLWVAITTVVLFFITPALSAYLNGMDLSSYGLNIFGEVRKLSDIGVNLMSNFGLSEFMTHSPALVQFAENVSIAVLNVVLFILLFWLTKWILGIPYLITARKMFDKKARDKKAYKQKVKKLQQKGSVINETVEETPIILSVTSKNRGLGLVFGLLFGMLICAVTLFPVVGLNSLYQEVYSSVTFTDEIEGEVPYLSTVLDDDIAAYINSYQDSFASEIMTYSGMGFLSNFLFDSLTTVQVNNENLSIVNEVSVGVKVFKNGMEIKDFAEDFDEATESSIAQALIKVKETFAILENSTALTVFGDELLPYFIEKEFIDKPSVTLMIGGEDYAEMLREAYNHYKLTKTVNVASVKEQVEAVVDIVVLLNNNHLVQPLLKNEINSLDNALSLVAENVGIASNFSQNLVNNLFMVSMIEYKYPEFIDNLLSTAFDEVGISGFESNVTNISSATLKTALKKLLENTINLVKNVNSHSNFDFGTQAKNTTALVQLGKIIDSAKNVFLSNTSYSQLLDFMQTKANDATSDFLDLSDIINKTNDISSWETELQSLAPLYTVVVKIVNENKKVNGEQYPQTFDYDKILEVDYEQLFDVGNVLQTVLDGRVSKIVTSENIKNIFSAIMDELVTDASLKDYLEQVKVNNVALKDIMLNNIWNGETTKITNWGNELKYSLEVVRKIFATFTDFDTARISQQTNTELKDFGRTIDDALVHTNLFLSNSAMRSFMEYFLNQTDFPEEFERILTNPNYYDGTYTVKETMLNNIWNLNNKTTKISSWETEFDLLKTLFGASFSGIGSQKYTEIGETLDSLAYSNILDRSIVRKIIVYYIDTETNDLDSALKSGPITSIKNIISSDVKYTSGPNNGKYQIEYGKEIPYLIDLVDIVNADYGLGAQKDRFEAIGAKFNSLLFQESKLFTKVVINQFVSHYINDSAFNVPSEYASIKTEIFGGGNSKLGLIENYELEFSLLLDATTLMSDTSSSLIQLGEKLDDIMEVDSVLITYSVVDKIIGILFDDKVNFTLDNGTDLIETIKNNVTGPDRKSIDASTSENFTKMFTELDTLKNNFSVFSEITSEAAFRNNAEGSDSIGKILDNINNNMTIAGDSDVAAEMADLVIDKIKTYLSDISSAIDAEISSYNQTHSPSTDADYYEGLINAILPIED